MLVVITLINTVLAILALVNFLSIRRPECFEECDLKVAVLLPVRNEESNIGRVLAEIQTQRGVASLTTIVINDGSEDGTRAIAVKHSGSNCILLDAPELPSGWIGKVHALHTGYLAQPDADIYISIDADVHFESEALAKAISLLNRKRLDFLSPYPRQIAATWAERLVQPLLQWSWMSTVFLRGAERFPLKSTVIANGQFFVIRGEALRTIGGFAAISNCVLDDIELGRRLVSAGFKGTAADGSHIAATRMYSSFSEIKSGYGKSLHAAFGSIPGSLFAATFIFISGVLPLILIPTRNPLALISLALIILTRLLSAWSSKGRARDAILHPLSAVLFIYLLYFSWRNKGKTQWKGRTL